MSSERIASRTRGSTTGTDMACSSGTRGGRDEFGPIVAGQPALFRGVKWPERPIGAGSHRPMVRGAAAERIIRISSRVALGVVAVEAAWVLWTMAGGGGYPIACDYVALRDAAARWLGGGGFYPPFQLAGPYATLAAPGATPVIMYPPLALWLFAPFVFLPAFLWWAIPLGLAVYGLAKLRPATWAWPLIAALALWPRIPEAIQNGNPAMWAFAFGCVALARGWTGPLLLLKPTLAPFALWGVRRRSWWVALAVMGGVSLLFGSMWVDYVRVLLNARDPNGILYSLNQVPTLLIPLVAWAGRRRELIAPYRPPAISAA